MPSNVYMYIYVISFRFEITYINQTKGMAYRYIGRASDDTTLPMPSADIMLAYYRDRLSNSCSYSLILDSSVFLTHWGRVTHICVSKLTIIDSVNGLSPGRRQAIIWTNVGIWLIGPLGTNFSEILIEIYTFSFKKMHLKMSSEKRRPSCLGLNVLIAGILLLGNGFRIMATPEDKNMSPFH